MGEYNTTGDIRIVYDAAQGYGDLDVVDRDLDRDAGLETAVAVSLFSNRRADAEDILPDADGGRAGWWADALNDDGDKIGSKLWLLGREAMRPQDVIPRAKQYAREALQWMIDDGVAQEIIANAERIAMNEIRLTINIVRPEVDREEFFSYYYNWAAQVARRA
jgi:phage gp46-like protein